jgi:hypothetical protein
VRTPGALDRARARLQALIWVRKLAVEEGYKTPEVLTIAEAEAIYGPVYFDQLDTICIISQVAVEHDQPGEPFFRPEMLAKNYSMTSLMALWDRICFYANHEDVRVHDIDEGMFLAVVAAIDQHKNITPLLALDGYLRDKAVTIMASRLSSFLTPKSSSPSTAKSTATPAG